MSSRGRGRTWVALFRFSCQCRPVNVYLGEDALKVTVSPGRAAYLVPEGDPDAFERAVALASSRWTGVTEPILSVGAEGRVGPAELQIAEVLDLAGLVNVGCPGKIVRNGIPGLDFPVIDGERLDHSLDLRSLPWHAVANGAAEYVSARPNAPLWEKVAAGIDSSNGRRWSAATDDNAGRAALGGRTMLDGGLAGFAESEATHVSVGPIVLWITQANSLVDCQAFWNYRALRCLRWPSSPIHLLPENFLRDWLGIEELLRGMVRGRQFGGVPDVVINSYSVDDAELVAIGEQLGLSHSATKELSLPSVSSIGEIEARSEWSFMTDVDPRAWLLFERTLGYDEWFRVQTFRERTAVPVLPDSLRSVINDHAGTPLRLRLRGGYLEQLPRTPATARAVLNTAVWSGEHLQSLVGISAKGLLNINAPSRDDVLRLVTDDMPGTVTLSDKGKLAASLLQRHDIAVLNSVTSFAVIQALTTRRHKELVKEISRLEDLLPQEVVDLIASLGGRVERSYRSAEKLHARGLAIREGLEVLEKLAHSGWVERGFRSSCPGCGLSSFVPLAANAKPDLCPQCGTLSSLSLNSFGVDLHYRLDALADRCSDQGVLSHVAVGSVLLAKHPFAALHLGADIAWEGGEKSEVDILGFLGSDLVAGEVKTSSSEFTPEQIDRDVALSLKLRARTHILAYIWGAEDVRFIERARLACGEAGLGLIVVCPDETGQLAVNPNSAG